MDGASRTRESALTEQVAASFDDAGSERLQQVLSALVRHAHAFVSEVRLTDDEWTAAVGFLTRTGQLCSDRRQEFVLLSDVLGISMLTVAVNSAADPRVTPSTVFGPFFVAGSPEVPLGGDVARGALGQPCWVEGTVRGLTGEPVAAALIEVWEADEEGLYDVQRPGEVAETAGRGHLFTDEEGRFRFWSVLPAPYPIPTDGPVGDLLAAGGRGSMRPAHIHFMIEAPGHRKLTTHVFVAGGPHLADDAVFGVDDALVADFVRHSADEEPPAGGPAGQPWSSLHYDFVLAPADAL